MAAGKVKVKAVKSGPMFRSLAMKVEAIDEDKRTLSLSWSSEEPVARWFGAEILDHGKNSVRMDRINDGAPLLFNHDMDGHIGTIEKAWLDKDRVARAVVRFGKSLLAEEKWKDVRDGILSKASFLYRIYKMVLEESSDEKGDTYRATDWEPFEISLVTVPADHTVGVGRSRAFDTEEREILIQHQPEVRMEATQVQSPTPTDAPAPTKIDVGAERDRARTEEKDRMQKILAMAQKHNAPQALTDQFLGDSGRTPGEFGAAILEWRGNQHRTIEHPVDAKIDLTGKERKAYSLLRAINAAMANDWSKAGFELECSRAVAGRIKREPKSFFFPVDVQLEGIDRDYVPPHVDPSTRMLFERMNRAQYMQRVLTAGTATDGAELVATNLLASSFIDVLRNAMVVRAAGATFLTGLVGNVAIPRKTSGSAATWVAEDGATLTSDAQFDQVTLSPKTLGAFTDLSRRLLIQSAPSAEALIRDDLAMALALEIDRAATQGTGASNQPSGIEVISGVNDVDLGANGAALTWANVVDMESQVANDNAAIGALAYLLNSKTIGKLKTTEKASTTGLFIFETNAPTAPVNGYPVFRTNQLRSNITKGSGSALSIGMFGNWRDVLIGEWGVIDVLVDPYTNSAKGTVRVRIMHDVDIDVRHPESFCFSNEIVTV